MAIKLLLTSHGTKNVNNFAAKKEQTQNRNEDEFLTEWSPVVENRSISSLKKFSFLI